METQNAIEMIPRWFDLPSARRRRLSVLIGRLALRRLTLPAASRTPEVETADERAVEPSE
jgi:hypothetical protein